MLVIGAGPAGLAAATQLLERGEGKLQVKLVHMGHHFGGKAASYADGLGRVVDHGWHMVLGFYRNMRALMQRAGIPTEVLTSLDGIAHVYERFDERLHTIRSGGGRLAVASRFLGYSGLPAEDRLRYARFMGQLYARVLTPEDLTRHDDVCFTSFAVEQGMLPHLAQYSLFRMFREVYFNFPEQVSAYHTLQTMRLMSTSADSEIFVVQGRYSEVIWDPIARYFERLGGTIEPYVMATDWIYEGRRLVGVRVARPRDDHQTGKASWRTHQLPVEPGTERVLTEFDQVISTVPNAVFVTMNRGDEGLWRSPYFARLKNLRSVATISMTATTRRPYAQNFPGIITGLPAPLGGTAVDMKRFVPAFRDAPGVGSALTFVGQEPGFEGWTDEEIVSFTLDNLGSVKQLGDPRQSELLDVELHRNRSDFERLLLCEPGVNRFRPGPKTPFHNLFLAGDWVRNRIDIVSMEGAVTSGLEAAGEVLAALEDE